MFSLQYLTGLLIAIPFFLVNLIAANPIRVSRYVLFASMAVIGTALAQLLDSVVSGWRPCNRRWGQFSRAFATKLLSAIVLAMVIVTGGFLALGTVHPPGHQLPQSTFSGGEWLLENENPSYASQSTAMSLKFEIYIEGIEKYRHTPVTFSRDDPAHVLPKHLGYHTNASIDNSLSGPTYLVTRERDREMYKRYSRTRRRDINYYTTADLRQLRWDPAADRIYSNGRFEAWLAD